MIRVDAPRHRHLRLPPLRCNEALADDRDFVDSALEQVRHISRYRPFTADTHVLDFGCGPGRFAIGLVTLGVPLAAYWGIDTNESAIGWCKRWLQPQDARFRFVHVPAHNARYNRRAVGTPPLPVPRREFDIAFVNSVFSHMLPPDVSFYLTALHDALQPAGILYMTAFLEENVAAVQENPPGYLGKKSRGPLHRVRYEKGYFFELIDDAGLTVQDFRYRGIERTGQSVIVAAPR